MHKTAAKLPKIRPARTVAGKIAKSVASGLLGAILSGATLMACASQAVETKVLTSTHHDVAPYRIGKDDLLDIIVWKEPQLSGKVRVIADGTVTLPLVGPVHAEGATCDQLQADLSKRLGQYTHDPNVTVRVASSAQEFYILGEVRKPGSYRLRSDEVLSQAIAEAGGFTDFANLRAVRIVRRSHDENSVITINYKQVLHGDDLSVDIPLMAGDTISVP